MKRLHQQLSENLTWYRNWHENPQHKVVHYGVLLGVLVLFGTMLASSTSIRAVGTTYYISPTGSNTAAGTAAAPWKTLAYACSTVSTTGSVIHVLPGTYTETAPCNLKVGVSIEGEGATSNIVSTYTGGAIINLVSTTDGTNGNQEVRFLKLDGNNLTGEKGIYVQSRSNVKIHDCTVQNFLNDGVIFKGAINGGQPTVYMTGNELYNCTITNNADRTAGGQGNIVATGYRGILIHDNIITQTSRPLGHNGNIMSATTEGFSEGLKFYNNKSYRNANDGLEWSFHLELWDSQGGMEVYNNEFHGGSQMIDWGGSEFSNKGIVAGSYPYAAYVHDNLFQFDAPIQKHLDNYLQEVAVNLEGNVEKVIISNNHFKNVPYAVQLTLEHTPDWQKNITINNNLFENGGFIDNEWGFDIDILTRSSGATPYVSNIQIINNTFVTNTQAALFIYSNAGSNVNNVTFSNNIVKGTRVGWMAFVTNDGVKSNFTVKNNLLYQNANNNAISLQSGAVLPTAWTYIGNIIANPLLDSTFHLQSGSPAIDAGVDVGLPFNGTKPDIGAYETTGSTDTTAPTVSVTNPTTGFIVSGNFPLQALASDNIGVAGVQFKLDGTNVGTEDTTSPYTYSLNSTAYTNGSHTFSATARDAAGNTTTSTAITATITNTDTTVPVVSLTAPTNNATYTLGTPITLSATATDNVAMARVDFLSGSTVIGTQSSGPGSVFSTTWTPTAAGLYTITAKAYDTSNNSATTSAVTITVTAPDSVAPTVTLTAPTGSYYGPGSSVTLKATASDNIGVTKVEFYVNDVLKCTDTTSSYTCSWRVPFSPVGSFALSAKAFDAAGNSTLSAIKKVKNTKTVTPTSSVNAGPDQAITLPTNTVTLSGSYTSGMSLNNTTTWSKVSGSGTITTPSALTTTVTGLTAGTSVFKLSMNDGTTTISDNVSIVVSAAPTGSISFPSALILDSLPSGSTISGGVSVELASVTSTNPITKVEFYQGSTLIGTDATSAPYSIAAGWNTATVANGTYTFTAKAYDNQGTIATTPAVTYTIAN